MNAVTPCRVGEHVIGTGETPLLIAGPCVMEGRDMVLSHARRIQRIAEEHGFAFCFKASFDKANRTSIHSYRGPGLKEGLKILAAVKRQVGVPVLTDFHSADQAAAVGEVVDVLQVPAFLCRQTDLLVAAAETGKVVNVKKGQFVAPESMAPVVEKLREAGCTSLLLTERGTTFGHGDLVVDFRGLVTMRGLGAPVVFDATHSTQRPGALGSKSGGDRALAPVLARAACAVGVDGLFLEVHEEPERALSDAATQLALADLPAVLERLRGQWDLSRDLLAAETPDG